MEELAVRQFTIAPSGVAQRATEHPHAHLHVRRFSITMKSAALPDATALLNPEGIPAPGRRTS
jgi:hypothetical protein